ncbi:MAG: hypothetical protein R3D03_02210 [Geminicoccaceae bacterium]
MTLPVAETGSRSQGQPLRLAAWLALGATYGGLSSPTPDIIGIAEMVVGGLLIATVGIQSLKKFAEVARPRSATADRSLADLGLATLLATLPLLVGIGRGNHPADIARDLIPALYFLIPLLIVRAGCPHQPIIPALTASLLVAGSAFSVRHMLSDDFSLASLGTQTFYGSMDYFVLDPAVLFTAAFGLSLFLLTLLDRPTPLRILLGVLLCTAPIMAIGATVIRSQIGILLAIGLFCILRSLRISLASLIGIVLAMAIFTLALLLFGDHLSGLFDLIERKQAAVGLANGRMLEIHAVWSEMTARWDLLLFGKGWGGTIVHPLGLAGQEWRFVHVFPLYLLMKVGLTGIAILAPLLLHLARAALTLLRQPGLPVAERAMALGCTASILVNVTVSAGFKMLSIGLVTALLLSLSARHRHQPRITPTLSSPHRPVVTVLPPGLPAQTVGAAPRRNAGTRTRPAPAAR